MLLDLIARSFEQRASWTLSGGHPRDPVIADWIGANQASKTGIVVNEKTALTHSAVWRAVNLRSMLMGDIPLGVFRKRSDGGKDNLSDHPVYPLVHDLCNADLFLTPFVRQQTSQNQKLTWGNSFAWIERKKNGSPVNLWPHPPNMVEMDSTKDGRLFYLFAGTRESGKTYDPSEVLHDKGMSPDGLWGWSRIRQARESIGQALAAQQFGGAYFGQGARMGTIITTAPGFRKEDIKPMLESIAAQTTGPDNWHRPFVIPFADKIQPITVPPDDAQFLGTQEWGVAEAARWFDVPLVFMMLQNSEPRANAEQDTLNFVTTTIAPECRSIEQELNIKLLSAKERAAGVFIEHNVDALLRGDFKSRMEGYNLALNNGTYSRNEVRRRENLDPIAEEDGGNLRTVPVQTLNLKALVNQTEPPNTTPKDEIVDTEHEPHVERSVDWLAVYEPMIVGAAERLLDKEEKAVQAAIRKHGTLRAEHLAEFYDGHLDAVRYIVGPIVRSIVGWDADESINDVANSYCRMARRSQWPQWKASGAQDELRSASVELLKDFRGLINGKQN